MPLDTLLRGSLDYAGVFPPAHLTTAAAIDEYRGVRVGAHGWMLGALVLPAERLDEPAVDALLPLALVMREPTVAATERIARASESRAIVALEYPPVAAADIPMLVQAAPRGCRCFVEVTPGGDVEAALDAVAAAGAFAKIRTGGVTTGAFPAAGAVCRFINGCVRRALPWKATAGLHHAVTGAYPLTYEAGSAAATMFGFLNLHVATVLTHMGWPERDVGAALTTSSPGVIAIEDDELVWGEYRVTRAAIAAARRLFLSVGSCSVREPIADLQRMRLL